MSTEKPFPWSLAEFVPIERDIPDPVGAVLTLLSRNKSIDPALAAEFRQIKRDDIDEFDVPDDYEGSWNEFDLRERK